MKWLRNLLRKWKRRRDFNRLDPKWKTFFTDIEMDPRALEDKEKINDNG